VEHERVQRLGGEVRGRKDEGRGGLGRKDGAPRVGGALLCHRGGVLRLVGVSVGVGGRGEVGGGRQGRERQRGRAVDEHECDPEPVRRRRVVQRQGRVA